MNVHFNCAVCAAALLAFSVPATAQNAAEPVAAPPSAQVSSAITLGADDTKSFAASLNTIARQAKIAIVAEGVPLRVTLPPKEAARLAKTLPLEDALDVVAAAYDYEVLRKPARAGGDIGARPASTVAILMKQYTEPDDLPDLPFDECIAILSDVEQILRVSGPRAKISVPSQAVLPIADALTPEMRERLKEGLPVSELPADLQQKARDLALHLFMGDLLKKATFGAEHLRAAQTTTVRYKPVPRGGKPLVLDNPKVADGTSFLVVDTDASVSIFTGDDGTNVYQPKPADLSPPDRERRAAIPEAITLKELIAYLQPRSAETLSLDPVLAEKTVTATGGKFAPPMDVLEGVAQMYGLRVLRPEEGKRKLTRRGIKFPQRMAGMYQAVRDMLPNPLRRAARDGDQNAKIQALVEEWITEGNRLSKTVESRPGTGDGITEAEYYKQRTPASRKLEQDQERIRNAAGLMGQAAVERFKSDVNPLLEKNPQGVAFASLEPATRRYYALSVLSGLMREMSYQIEAPPYLDDWSNARLWGGPAVPEKGIKVPAFALYFVPDDKRGDVPRAGYTAYDNRRKLP